MGRFTYPKDKPGRFTDPGGSAHAPFLMLIVALDITLIVIMILTIGFR